MKNEELKYYRKILKRMIYRRMCLLALFAKLIISVFILHSSLFIFTSCARMGAPDGGWYDEKPPYVVSATPEENATNVTSRKVTIRFNEFIKLESANEKVIVSPPQMQQPEIKVTGKNIYVNLLDSLKPNTTYTIDFSDAISDNNEGNPMGNYSYTFSTGDAIDTLQVSGYVLDASNLEPVKGILVGLYAEGDSIMKRVARADSRGHFIIWGVAPGSYTVGALMDVDGDYRFTQRSEKMAFSHDIIVPSCKPDVRQDTLWQDQNHIKDISLTGYTHFYPDDIVLRAFDHQLTNRYFLKAERKNAENFTLFFTAPVVDSLIYRDNQPLLENHRLPSLHLLNAPSHMQGVGDKLFIVEPSLKADTVRYWLRDMALVNQDTLRIEMATYISDSLGVQRLTKDTLEILSKSPYAKRQKVLEDEMADWRKEVAKRLRRAEPGEVVDTVMPAKKLEVRYSAPSVMSPTDAVMITFPSPLEKFDKEALHLYVEQDSLWYRSPFTVTPVKDRTCEVYTDWLPGAKYSFEVDSLAFTDIYGVANGKYKIGIQVGKLEDYASLFVNVNVSVNAPVIVQLLDKQDKVLMTAEAKDGTAEFYYIVPETYYLRAFVDSNGNGEWDTGDYFTDRQPEDIYYYSEPVECRAKWDITKTWNLTSKPLFRQKPDVLKKEKGDTERIIKKRNEERARNKGIPLPDYLK